jgi:putative alpha-1,2-mannosidase
VDRAVIDLPSGKKLTVKVNRKKGGRTGLGAVRLNGRPQPMPSVSHRALLQGGLLEMEVGE